MRFCIATASALLASILVAPVGAQGGPTFKSGSLSSEGNTQYRLIVSDDRKAAIVMFDGLENQLDGIGAPLFGTRVFSISLPLAGARKGAKLGVYLEGAAAGLKGTDLSLITTVNGQTHAMDFARLASSSGGVESDDCAKMPSAEERTDAMRKADANKTGAKAPDSPKTPAIASQPEHIATDLSYVQCILLDAASASDLRIHVVLAVNRHSRDAAGYVNVAVLGAHFLPEEKGAK
jgi:hypothetical protein